MAERGATLQTYRRKRDFSRTREPSGQKAPGRGYSFVVQKHAARRLHYDFRLELDGVLLSWAVPKGPSLDPGVKRLAVQVEDHPVEYGGFEGTIPKGEYGGGTVMVWDRGRYEPEGDARKAYRAGRLNFELFGEKLKGRWHLVRTRSRGADDGKSWLLFKSDDAQALRDGDAIVDTRPDSALTGRTMDQISAGKSGKRKSPRVSGEPPKLELTNPDKVFFPEQGTTKRDLAEYYAKVAGYMLPHVTARPLTLVRCPEGRHKHCFFQKHANDGMPESIRSVPIRERTGDESYMAIDDGIGLLSLVQMGVLEIHTWGASSEDPEHPDLIVIDLDPDPSVRFARVIDAAKLVRDRFDQLGLESFVKTTGGKGLHVCVPLTPRLDWDTIKEFCRRFAEQIVEADPDHFVATMSKQKRAGKIFVDYFRNGRGATFIAPYSTRARPGAPVATPLEWRELDAKLDPAKLDLKSVPRRLAELKSDPWARLWKLRQSLGEKTLQALDGARVKPNRRRAASARR
jgi:bifunctional non-homologous end joining protein LigD